MPAHRMQVKDANFRKKGRIGHTHPYPENLVKIGPAHSEKIALRRDC